LLRLGFEVVTTSGTHDYLALHGLQTHRIKKISEGRPNAVDLMKNRELVMIFNTPTRKGPDSDEGRLRATAVRLGIPMITTMTGAAAAVKAMTALREGDWGVAALQDYYPRTATVPPSETLATETPGEAVGKQ
jgi:carbamoyl-phosphate synthase large subunit